MIEFVIEIQLLPIDICNNNHVIVIIPVRV